jgi:hypothetical protein
LDKEFLIDYEIRENEELADFRKRLSEGTFSANQMFQKKQRFKKLNSPVTYLGEMNAPLWSTVAFSGSTIIPLLPAPKLSFEKMHGFRITEIEQMVNLAEETGKIQFVLLNKPTDYLGLEFLNPIFTTLKPPQFSGIPLDAFVSRNVFEPYDIEFDTLSSLGFADYTQRKMSHNYTSNLIDLYLYNVKGNYMMLKSLLADSDLSNDISDALVSDYERFYDLLLTFDVLVLRPMRNPLRCVESYSVETIRKVHQMDVLDKNKARKKEFPYEIGRLLLRELTLYPESLEACKQLVAKYEEQDVLKLFNAINSAIMKNKPDAIEENEAELSNILKNIWKDKKIRRGIAGIKFGVPLALGVIGTVVAGFSGAYVGLLSGIGFDVIDKVLEFKQDAFSEKIAKTFCSSYQAIIFDFQKRYRLDA